MYRGLNDYEIIYLIKDNNEEALNLMYKKYLPFIYKKIREFHIYNEYKEDFVQEGYMSIYVAVKTFDETLNKTFYKYLELIMERNFIKLYKKVCKLDIPVSNLDLIIMDEISEYNKEKKDYNFYFNEGLKFFEGIEREIYIYLYKDGLSSREIAKILNMNIKKIYNLTQKIKNILNRNLNID